MKTKNEVELLNPFQIAKLSLYRENPHLLL